jgi:hypothetical protein
MVSPNLDDHFDTFANDPESGQYVRKDTVDPALFRFEEKPDRIVVPGGEKVAILTTKEAFGDYILNFWYRWGEKNFLPPRRDDPTIWPDAPDVARRAGIILHVTGADGAAIGGIYPHGITVRLGDGDAGNIRIAALPGTVQCKARVKESPDRLRRDYVGGDAPELPHVIGDPEKWPGGIFRRGFPADVTYGGRADVVCDGLVAGALGGSPFGWVAHTRLVIGKGWHPDGDPTIKKATPPYGPNDWNRVRLECIKGRLTVFVNQKRVNEVTDLNLTKGKIAISSQMAEYEIGLIDVDVKPPG